jgi:hypothetical protein
MNTSIQITQSALMRLDAIRKQRGIRTRAKALEVVLSELWQPDPLEVILQSPKSSDPIPDHILSDVQADRKNRSAGKKIKTTTHEAVKARLEARGQAYTKKSKRR